MKEAGIQFILSTSSFNPLNSVSEMSGGQTTILALALSLAIQHIFPAPFFCIDEADSDLDNLHRMILKDVLVSLSQKGKQFFIITNHSKLIKEEKGTFFLVRSDSGISSCENTNADNAQQIINDKSI